MTRRGNISLTSDIDRTEPVRLILDQSSMRTEHHPLSAVRNTFRMHDCPGIHQPISLGFVADEIR